MTGNLKENARVGDQRRSLGEQLVEVIGCPDPRPRRAKLSISTKSRDGVGRAANGNERRGIDG
jgi:hypothetical protein